ncbi:hypothetical protein KIPB_005709, partial [Kipferlia bialata]|eukprot:g5709.t1
MVFVGTEKGSILVYEAEQRGPDTTPSDASPHPTHLVKRLILSHSGLPSPVVSIVPMFSDPLSTHAPRTRPSLPNSPHPSPTHSREQSTSALPPLPQTQSQTQKGSSRREREKEADVGERERKGESVSLRVVCVMADGTVSVWSLKHAALVCVSRVGPRLPSLLASMSLPAVRVTQRHSFTSLKHTIYALVTSPVGVYVVDTSSPRLSVCRSKAVGRTMARLDGPGCSSLPGCVGGCGDGQGGDMDREASVLCAGCVTSAGCVTDVKQRIGGPSPHSKTEGERDGSERETGAERVVDRGIMMVMLTDSGALCTAFLSVVRLVRGGSVKRKSRLPSVPLSFYEPFTHSVIKAPSTAELAEARESDPEGVSELSLAKDVPILHDTVLDVVSLYREYHVLAKSDCGSCKVFTVPASSSMYNQYHASVASVDFGPVKVSHRPHPSAPLPSRVSVSISTSVALPTPGVSVSSHIPDDTLESMHSTTLPLHPLCFLDVSDMLQNTLCVVCRVDSPAGPSSIRGVDGDTVVLCLSIDEGDVPIGGHGWYVSQPITLTSSTPLTHGVRDACTDLGWKRRLSVSAVHRDSEGEREGVVSALEVILLDKAESIVGTRGQSETAKTARLSLHPSDHEGVRRGCLKDIRPLRDGVSFVEEAPSPSPCSPRLPVPHPCPILCVASSDYGPIAVSDASIAGSTSIKLEYAVLSRFCQSDIQGSRMYTPPPSLSLTIPLFGNVSNASSVSNASKRRRSRSRVDRVVCCRSFFLNCIDSQYASRSSLSLIAGTECGRVVLVTNVASAVSHSSCRVSHLSSSDNALDVQEGARVYVLRDPVAAHRELTSSRSVVTDFNLQSAIRALHYVPTKRDAPEFAVQPLDRDMESDSEASEGMLDDWDDLERRREQRRHVRDVAMGDLLSFDQSLMLREGEGRVLLDQPGRDGVAEVQAEDALE